MKNLKKIFALLVTVVMVMGMSVTAFAASITIKSGAASDATDTTSYTAYEIFKADIANATQVAYYIPAGNDALIAAVKATTLFKVTLSADGSRYNVELKDSTTSSTVIAAALSSTDITDNALSAPITFSQNAGSAKVDGLDAGYYLIKSSLGTALAVQTVGDVEITEKNTYPTAKKTDNIADDTVSIGDTVTYTITVTIPASVEAKDITVYDTITKGLTMNTAITVTGATGFDSLTWSENSDYTATNGEKQYTAVISAANVKANAGKDIVLTYTAEVNDNAVVKAAEENKAYIKYDNYTSVETGTKVTTYGFKLKKVSEDEKTQLEGAEFTLWTSATGGSQIFVTKDDNGVYRVDSSAANGEKIVAGQATIEGLKAGTYYLQEEKAPTGYNLLTERKEIVVSETTDGADVDISVVNKAGSSLPSTGGIGTTIFYVIGAVLVLGAGVLLVARKKASVK